MNFYLELFGYIGTALVILSMMMTSVTKLRGLNICGSVISCIYSCFCNAYPVAVMNGALVIINVVQLLRKARSEESFARVAVHADDGSLHYFLSRDSQGTETLPSCFRENADRVKQYLIYRENEAVGFVIGMQVERVFLVGAVRTASKDDNAVKTFLISSFRQEGIETVVTDRDSEEYRHWMHIAETARTDEER